MLVTVAVRRVRETGEGEGGGGERREGGGGRPRGVMRDIANLISIMVEEKATCTLSLSLSLCLPLSLALELSVGLTMYRLLRILCYMKLVLLIT